MHVKGERVTYWSNNQMIGNFGDFALYTKDSLGAFYLNSFKFFKEIWPHYKK